MVHQQAGDPSFLHDAFISYSRKDRPFAVVLQRALNGYTPPSGLPVARRRLNVFRDEEDFTGTEYFQAVRHHLAGSRKLIVLCSPHARASKFVDDEIRSFARTHAAQDLIPVLIAGRPEMSGSPDDSHFAFPAALCEILELPLAADYREFDPKAAKLDSPPWRTAWFKLLADLCNCSRAEIEMREQRRKVRQRLQWGAGITAVSVALAVAAFVADNASRLAESNDLASQALGIAGSDPDRGTALALDAIGKRRTPLAVSALRAAQASLPELQAAVAPDGGPNDPMVFSPDGQRLVVADGEAGARVLDAQTGKPLLQLATQGKPTGGIQFSPDGRLAALADFEEGTSVHDMATGRRLATVNGTLSWLAPSADGDGVPRALVAREGTARMVALQPDGSERILQGVALPDLSGASWAVSPDGRRLAVATEGGGTGRLAIIDLASGKVQAQTGAFSTAGVAWSPRGTWLVSKWLTGFAVFDTRGRTRPFVHDTGDEISVEDVAFSPDETLLATTDRGGLTTLWDLAQGKVAGKFQGPGARAYTPDFSADGALLSVVFSNGQASLFELDARNRELVQDPLVTLEGTWGELVAARFSPSGKDLIARYAGGKLVAWSIERWLPRHRLPLRYEAKYQSGRPQGLDDLELAPDGSVIATKQGGRWRGWNTASGAEISERPKDMAPLARAARLESDGGRRSLRLAGQQVLLQTPGTASVLRLAHSDAVTSASFNPSGACVVSTSGVVMASGGTPPSGNRVRLWDAETGALLRDWGLAAPPDAAFFAGSERVVVLYAGQAFVYPAPLCGSEDALLQRASATRPSAD